MGSTRYVTRYIALGRVTRVVVIFAGTVAAFGDASVAFVYGDHHRVVVRGKGSDQRVHVFLHPSCQVAPDGLRYGGNGGVKVEVGEGVPKMAEDTGERMPRLLSSTSWRALSDRVSRHVTTSAKKRR